jgi:hypothetical protein
MNPKLAEEVSEVCPDNCTKHRHAFDPKNPNKVYFTTLKYSPTYTYPTYYKALAAFNLKLRNSNKGFAASIYRVRKARVLQRSLDPLVYKVTLCCACS